MKYTNKKPKRTQVSLRLGRQSNWSDGKRKRMWQLVLTALAPGDQEA